MIISLTIRNANPMLESCLIHGRCSLNRARMRLG